MKLSVAQRQALFRVLESSPMPPRLYATSGVHPNTWYALARKGLIVFVGSRQDHIEITGAGRAALEAAQ